MGVAQGCEGKRKDERAVLKDVRRCEKMRDAKRCEKREAKGSEGMS